jgi:hypothetical protein
LLENQQLLKELSNEYEIVYGEVGEGWMGSSAGRYSKGKRTWQISYMLDKNPEDFEISGKPPKAFEEIKERLLSKSPQYGNYHFEVPVELFDHYVGFRYYHYRDSIDKEAFESLDFRATFPLKPSLSEEERKEAKEIIRHWKAASGQEKLRLTKMLTDTKILVGTTRDEAMKLLGPPKSKDSTSLNYKANESWEISFHFDSKYIYVGATFFDFSQFND